VTKWIRAICWCHPPQASWRPLRNGREVNSANWIQRFRPRQPEMSSFFEVQTKLLKKSGTPYYA
jgi:hypothetical protein